jgi:hypothetical protein
MLRDPHDWINTTSFGHGKSLPCQQRVEAVVSTFFKADLLHHLKNSFVTWVPPRRRLPAVRETATVPGIGVTRLSGDGDQ